jgi:hypothetical protein
MDESGKVYQRKNGQVHFEDNGQPYRVLTTPGPTPQVFRNLHETLDFQAVDSSVKRLTLQVKQLDFGARPYAAFSIDLGSHPSVGDRWLINQALSVGDLSFSVNSARLVALDKDAPGSRGQPWVGLVLDLSPMDPNQVQLTQIWLRVWGSQAVYDRASTTWAAAWLPGQVPSGMIEIHLDSVQGNLIGDWEIQWEHQKP